MSPSAVPASRMLNAYITDEIAPVLLGAGFKAALPWMQGMSTISALISARAERHALTSAVMEVAALFALGQKTVAAEAAALLAKAKYPA